MNSSIESACLKGLVDLFGVVLVGLFDWELCFFELQELAPQNLRKEMHEVNILVFAIHIFLFVETIII